MWVAALAIIGSLAILIGVTLVADSLLPAGDTLPNFDNRGNTFESSRFSVLWGFLLVAYPVGWGMSLLWHYGIGVPQHLFGMAILAGAFAAFLQAYSILGTFIRIRRKP